MYAGACVWVAQSVCHRLLLWAEQLVGVVIYASLLPPNHWGCWWTWTLGRVSTTKLLEYSIFRTYKFWCLCVWFQWRSNKKIRKGGIEKRPVCGRIFLQPLYWWQQGCLSFNLGYFSHIYDDGDENGNDDRVDGDDDENDDEDDQPPETSQVTTRVSLNKLLLFCYLFVDKI